MSARCWKSSERDSRSDPEEPLLKGLRDRRSHVKGQCAECKFFEACGGSLRVRADLALNDCWAPDPACYLTDAEIGLGEEGERKANSTSPRAAASES